MPEHLLIRNGTVYDGTGSPAQSLDVRIRNGRISETAAHLPTGDATVFDADGMIVAPGLIDLHVHVFTGIGQWSISPAEAGLRTGVTTMLDTGTAGALTFAGFQQHVIDQAEEDIFALLNISLIGCIQGHPDVSPWMGELCDARFLDVPTAVACIKRFPERLIGMKVRLTDALADYDLTKEEAGLRGALQAADETDTFAMFHHSNSAIPFERLATALRPGDVVTHLYHPNRNAPFTDQTHRPTEALLAARERGVLFDVGHGVGSFSWPVAEAACQQFEFWPDTISTDIHQFGLHGPVFDLPTTLSKFLHLGMPLAHVIHAASAAPAKAMKMDDRFGLLRPGRQADVTLLKIETGPFELADVNHNVRTLAKRLVPTGVFKNGRYQACQAAAIADQPS